MSDLPDNQIPFAPCSASRSSYFTPLEVLAPLDMLRDATGQRAQRRVEDRDATLYVGHMTKLYPQQQVTDHRRSREERDFVVELCQKIGHLPCGDDHFGLRVATLALGLHDDAPWPSSVRHWMAVYWLQRPYLRHLETALTDHDGRLLGMQTIRAHRTPSTLALVLPALPALPQYVHAA